MDTLPPALRQGVEEFNRAYFFEAHETLEELWRETSGPLRPFYQGLIQLAVALYHLSNGNRRGALNLLIKVDVEVSRGGRLVFPWDSPLRPSTEATTPLPSRRTTSTAPQRSTRVHERHAAGNGR
jgi:hypothetical protein